MTTAGHHSTADDFAGVFHMVRVCIWLFWAATYLTGFAQLCSSAFEALLPD